MNPDDSGMKRSALMDAMRMAPAKTDQAVSQDIQSLECPHCHYKGSEEEFQDSDANDTQGANGPTDVGQSDPFEIGPKTADPNVPGA